MSIAAIILAAGQGTRMKSALPKVLRPIAGLPMLGQVVAALKAAGVTRLVVVTAETADAVRACAASLGCESGIQDKQLGSGHAAPAAANALKDFSGTLLIANGDMPLLTAEAVAAVLKAKETTGLSLLACRMS